MGNSLVSKDLVTYPRLTVVCAVMAAYGSMLACNEASWWWALIVPLIVIGALKLALINLIVNLQNKLLLCILICVPNIFYWTVFARLPRTGPNDLSNYAGRTVIFYARINTVDMPPQLSRVRLMLAPYTMLFPDRKELQGQTVLTLRSTGDSTRTSFRPGMLLQVKGLVRRPLCVVLPWEFDTKRFLARKGIFSTCMAKSADVQVLRNDHCHFDRRSEKNGNVITFLVNSFSSSIERLRSRIVEIHKRNIGAKEGSFLSSIVLGDRAVSLDEDLKKDFRDVGLSHLLAASGFNLTVVTGVTYWLARFLCQSLWLVNGISFVSMLMFVCLAGCSPSIMRAALMCTMLLFSRCVFRTLHAPAALAMALLITLVLDPTSITDVGLQLSYAATVGIICGATISNEALAENKQPKLLKWLMQTISVVVSAQIAVIPLQLLYFWKIGLLFLPANLLVDPLVMPVSVLGFISSSLSLATTFGFLSKWLEPAIKIMDLVALYPIKVMLGIASFLASFDSAKLVVGPPQLWSLLLYYWALCVFIFVLKHKRYQLLSGIFLALATVFLFWRPALPNVTMAVFPYNIAVVSADRSLVCVNRRTDRTLRLCYGDSSKSDVVDKNLDRFLAYHGIRNLDDRHFVLDPFLMEGAFQILNEKLHVRLVIIDQRCNLRAFLEEIRSAQSQQLWSKSSQAISSKLLVFLYDKGRDSLTRANPFLVEIQKELKLGFCIVIRREPKLSRRYVLSQSDRVVEVDGVRIISPQHAIVSRLDDIGPRFIPKRICKY